MRLIPVATALLMASGLCPGCSSRFDGPYPCVTGFASCTFTPPNQCETDITSSPAHCGGCGIQCPQGALCVKGKCTAAPTVLAKDVSLTTGNKGSSNVRMNATQLFYYSTDGTLVSIPKTGGTPSPVTLPSSQVDSQSPYAVDDTSVYYVGNSVSSGMAILAVPSNPPVATPSPRTVTSIPTTWNIGGVSGFVVVVGTLVFFGNNNGNATIVTVPTSGGAPTKIGSASFLNNVEPVGAGNAIYFEQGINNGCEIDRQDLVEGSKPVILQSNQCPGGLATDGSFVYWPSSYQGVGDTKSYGTCVLVVNRAAAAGGVQPLLGEIAAGETPMQIAVDTTNVYVATSQSIWKVPVAGGTPVRVAGNLGMSKDTSSGCFSDTSMSGSIWLGVDAQNVYVSTPAVGSPGQVLLAIPK